MTVLRTKREEAELQAGEKILNLKVLDLLMITHQITEHH